MKIMSDNPEEKGNIQQMAWNEPGGSDDERKKDPWGSPSKGEQGPPDLDDIVKQMQGKVTKLFGGKRGGGGDSGAGGGGMAGGPSSSMISLIIAVFVIVWLGSGIYIIDPAERGVVMRFGQYVDTTLPGPHWHIPYPVESVEVVDVDQIQNVEVGYRSTTGREASSVPQEALMLTQDENIVDIKFAVQYRVKDAKDYLFSVREPNITLREATESAIREAVGKSKMDFVLTQGQSDIAERTQRIIQEILDRYNTGLQVTSVNLQSAQPPQEVKGAFEDAIKAREDQQRLINNAEAYSNDILPKARGAAARQLEEANAYKERVIAQAEGESSRFEQLLKEYEKAPKVTRDRLYLETIESVMQNTTKVMVDVKAGNNLLYLPLDKMINQSADSGSSQSIPQFSVPAPTQSAPQDSTQRRLRETLRNRSTR